jgi:tripartite-type tricarboxylate transporter receptor subunit TctC
MPGKVHPAAAGIDISRGKGNGPMRRMDIGRSRKLGLKSVVVEVFSLALAGATLLGAASAQEQDFFRGKQINIIVSAGPGTGYDLYARYLARHMGKYIPGNPTFVVQNMPGAGGLTATNHLYNRAPRDGLTIATVQGTLTFAQVGKSPSAQFDMRRFGWLGSANITSNVCAFTKAAGVESTEDLFKKKLIVGASGGSTEFVPNLLNAMLDTKFNVVKGYTSTQTVLVAAERGEVDGICGWGWDGAKVTGKDYFDRGVLSVRLESGNEPHPDLAAQRVPFMMDLVKDDEKKRLLQFLFSYLVYVRPFIAPPDIPADRLKMLQDGFAAAFKDPELLAEAAKADLDFRYVSPDQVKTALSQALDAPEDLKARAMEELRKAGWAGL